MPSYRGIHVSLVSQFDILTVPEYAPPLTYSESDPFREATIAVPRLIEDGTSIVSVYVPTYPSSQFWISYRIAPSLPSILYYFKLIVDGIDVVSWGCGEQDDYKGKTMFGLFRSEGDFGDVDRRALCFAPEEVVVLESESTSPPVDRMMEIKIYRSNGRRRIKPQLSVFVSSPAGRLDTRYDSQEGAVRLFDAGMLSRKHPQRFYQYVLIDPVERPFATFRYYHRTWAELERMGVTSPRQTPEPSSMSESNDGAEDDYAHTASFHDEVAKAGNESDQHSPSTPPPSSERPRAPLTAHLYEQNLKLPSPLRIPPLQPLRISSLRHVPLRPPIQEASNHQSSPTKRLTEAASRPATPNLLYLNENRQLMMDDPFQAEPDSTFPKGNPKAETPSPKAKGIKRDGHGSAGSSSRSSNRSFLVGRREIFQDAVQELLRHSPSPAAAANSKAKSCSPGRGRCLWRSPNRDGSSSPTRTKKSRAENGAEVVAMRTEKLKEASSHSSAEWIRAHANSRREEKERQRSAKKTVKEARRLGFKPSKESLRSEATPASTSSYVWKTDKASCAAKPLMANRGRSFDADTIRPSKSKPKDNVFAEAGDGKRSTSALGKEHQGSMGSLKGVVDSAMRRRARSSER